MSAFWLVLYKTFRKVGRSRYMYTHMGSGRSPLRAQNGQLDDRRLLCLATAVDPLPPANRPAALPAHQPTPKSGQAPVLEVFQLSITPENLIELLLPIRPRPQDDGPSPDLRCHRSEGFGALTSWIGPGKTREDQGRMYDIQSNNMEVENML